MQEDSSKAVERRSAHVSWVDTAKGIGIILVVLGHTLRGLINADVITWTPAAHFVDTWIYAFHMPLFFFLSGLFLPRSSNNTSPAFIWDKLRTIAYPYFLWSLITIAIKASPLGQGVNYPRGLQDIPLIFYAPIEQYWFLYVLFLLAIVTGYLLKLGASTWILLLIAILIYPGILPIPILGWEPLYQVRFYAIYLVLGIAVGRYGAVDSIDGIRSAWLAFAVVLGVAVSSLAGLQDIAYRSPLQFIFAIGGLAAVAGLAMLIDKAERSATLQLLGRYSLEIFVAHTIFSAALRIALQKQTDVTAPALYVLLGTAAGLVIPIFLAIALRRIGVPAYTLPRHRRATRYSNPEQLSQQQATRPAAHDSAA